MSRLIPAAIGAALLACAVPASAHVSLDTQEAAALAYQRIAIRVPHGCEGAPTTALRMQVPEGVTAVKPMPKPGWTLSLVADPSKPGPGGHDEAPPVREVAWRAGPGHALPDAYYDEFVLRVRMPDAAGQTLWFPFVQECEGGKVSRWIERPGAGQGYNDVARPAYPVRIIPRQ